MLCANVARHASCVLMGSTGSCCVRCVSYTFEQYVARLRRSSGYCAGMLTSLMACQPHPTLILQLEDMQEDLLRFTYKLYAMLGQAGVLGLQMPPRVVMRKQFGAYLKASRQPVARGDESVQYTLSRSQV